LTFVAFVVAADTRWKMLSPFAVCGSRFTRPASADPAASDGSDASEAGCVTALPSTFSAFAADTVAR
jgi:hypothetical protein